MLHSLSRSTKELSTKAGEQLSFKRDMMHDISQKYRTRAFMFADALTDKQVQGLCTKRKRKQPFGLMDGSAGDICFLSDLLRDENEVRMPGYEI
jgi:hypothetical protein